MNQMIRITAAAPADGVAARFTTAEFFCGWRTRVPSIGCGSN